MINLEQILPGRGGGFPCQQGAEDDAVAAQQDAGDVFDGTAITPAAVDRRGLQDRVGLGRQRPSSGVFDAKRIDAPVAALLVFRHQQRPQPFEAVGVRPAFGDQFGQRGLHLRVEHPAAFRQFLEERSALGLQHVQDPPRAAADFHFAALLAQAAPSGGAAALQQGDGGGFHRRQRGLRRGQPGPDVAPGQAQGVEPSRVVAVKAGGQDVAFPGNGGGFKAFQLFQHGGEGVRAFAASVRQHPLPAEQEAQEVGGGNRLDFLAQAIEGVMVDAGQQAAFAPFHPLPRPLSQSERGEITAQDQAFGFQFQQSQFNLRCR